MTMNESFFILVRIYSREKFLNYCKPCLHDAEVDARKMISTANTKVCFFGKKNSTDDNMRGIIVSRLTDSEVKL